MRVSETALSDLSLTPMQSIYPLHVSERESLYPIFLTPTQSIYPEHWCEREHKRVFLPHSRLIPPPSGHDTPMTSNLPYRFSNDRLSTAGLSLHWLLRFGGSPKETPFPLPKPPAHVILLRLSGGKNQRTAYNYVHIASIPLSYSRMKLLVDVRRIASRPV